MMAKIKCHAKANQVHEPTAKKSWAEAGRGPRGRSCSCGKMSMI